MEQIKINAKMLVKNGERLLVLASTEENGAIEYDLPGGEINSGTDIISGLSKNLNKVIKTKANNYSFLTKTNEQTLEGENIITLYYSCDIGKDVLEVHSDYDGYYWFEIEDICAQPVLPIWIKGAALLLEGIQKTNKQKADDFRQRAANVCESLGAKTVMKANGEHTYKSNNKIFCTLNDSFLSLINNSIDAEIISNIDGVKITDKKGNRWLKIPLESNLEDNILLDLIRDSYEAVLNNV